MTREKTLLAMAVLMAAVLMAALSGAVLSAQTPRPPQTFPAYLQGQYATLKRNIVGSVDKMPAEQFFFKPAPEVMSYAELLMHVIETQYAYCYTVKGGNDPAKGKDFKLVEKAAIAVVVKDSFAYCDDAFAALTSESALEMITAGAAPNQRQLARVNQLTQLIVHGNEHYGNLVTYMRIKGIVPPSSSPQ